MRGKHRIQDFLELLDDASRYLDDGRWQSTVRILEQITAVVDALPRQMHWHQPKTLSDLDPDARQLDELLDENELLNLFFALNSAGVLWNQVLQPDKALHCFMLARDLCLYNASAGVSQCVGAEEELNIICCCLHTREYSMSTEFVTPAQPAPVHNPWGMLPMSVRQARVNLAALFPNVPVATTQVSSTVAMVVTVWRELLSDHELASGVVRQCLSKADLAGSMTSLKAQHYLLHLAGILKDIKQGKEARSVLSLWDNKRTIPSTTKTDDYDASRVFDAQVYSLRASMPGGPVVPCVSDYWKDEEKSIQQNTDVRLCRAVSLWKELNWPLEHAEEIMDICTKCALHRCKQSWLHLPSTQPAEEIVETIKYLYTNILCHMHPSCEVAYSFHRLAGEAYQSSEYVDACWFEERVLQIYDSYQLPVKASMLEIVATGNMVLGQQQVAIQWYDRLASVLENPPSDTDWHAEAFILGLRGNRLQEDLLCRTYDALYYLSASLNNLESMMLYSQKAIEHVKKTMQHVANNPVLQTRNARCFHQKAVLLKKEGCPTEAEECFSQAKNMFVEAAQASSSPAPDQAGTAQEVLLWYGILLLNLEQHEGAEQLFLKASQPCEEEHLVLFYKHDITLPADFKSEVELQLQPNISLPVQLAAMYFMVLASTAGGMSKHSRTDLEERLSNFERFLGMEFHAQILVVTATSCRHLAFGYRLLGHLYHSLLGDSSKQQAAFQMAAKRHERRNMLRP